MNKESFLRILQGAILFYEADQPYFVKSQLNLTTEELKLSLEVFRMLRFQNIEEEKIQNAI